MNDITKINLEYAYKENWALEATITKLKEGGYMDDSYNAINGHPQSYVNKVFEVTLENFKKMGPINTYKPIKSSFEGLLSFRKKALNGETHD